MFLKVTTVVLWFLTSLCAMSQPISTANLRAWYDPVKDGDFRMQLVNHTDSVHVFYQVDTSRFEVRWEKRDSYSERSGEALLNAVMDPENQSIRLPVPAKPWLLLAIVRDKSDNESTMHFQLIESNYPIDCTIRRNNSVVFSPYLLLNTLYTIHGTTSTLTVFYFADDFPPAASPFTETSLEVDPVLDPDSTFTISNNSSVAFDKEGLFLIQSDPNAARGTAVLVVGPSYPKLSRVHDLAEALVFISTREEYQRLVQAGTDKVKFDKVILDITRDKERAKNVIRKYFRRVELANIMFSSFKEGWKTDRGMTYVIFGPPEEVSRTGSTEVWTYKKLKSKFVFNRAASIYDPNNFILQRDKRHMETWYYTIDMWRKNQVNSSEQN